MTDRLRPDVLALGDCLRALPGKAHVDEECLDSGVSRDRDGRRRAPRSFASLRAQPLVHLFKPPLRTT